MAYTIYKSDGTVLTTIADGTKDNLTSLTLSGPNFVGYGEYLVENLVYLLENFASNSAPSGQNLQGQLWFNKSSQTLNVFTTDGYLPVSGISIGTVQPLNANEGNTWFNTATNQYFMYDGTVWNLIGPVYTKAQGVSGAIPLTVADSSISGVFHDIVKIQFGSSLIAIFTDAPNPFVPSPTIAGFPVIYPGLTIHDSLFPGSGQFYTNANTAAYLPSDPTIINIQNSITSVNGNVATLAISANAAIEAANVSLNNKIAQANITINNTISNAVATLNAQANAIVANTNALLSNVQANIASLSANLSANIGQVIDGLNNVTVAWTANAASQQGQINSLVAGAYTNSNVAAYMPVYGGNISAGTVTATTQPYNNISTRVATTAYVNSVLPYGMIVMWSGSVATIPTGWQLCNGSNNTPDLRNQFIVGAGSGYAVGATGGASSVSLSTGNMPAHTHSFNNTTSTGVAGEHSHSLSITVSDPGHDHVFKGGNSLGGDQSIYVAYAGGAGAGVSYAGSGSIDHSTTGITASGGANSTGSHQHSISISGSTGSNGSGNAFNILPPYYALCFIMKTY